MPPLYVIQQGAKLRIHNRQLQVEQDEADGAQVLARLPLGQVDQVVLFGNISLTTPALHALLLRGVEVIFLSEDGQYLGRLTGEITPHVPLRRAQYRSLERPDFVLQMAKGFVRAKMSSQKALLNRHNREQHDPLIQSAVDQIDLGLRSLEHRTALSSLRGLEGATTAAYFSGFRRLIGDDWHFTARLRRPPPDPINVLLSLGYTILSRLASSMVQAVGLDPYAGYLHELVYNRPALGLDLLEEFRPVVDGVVLWCCRGGMITRQDFSPGPPERPVVLSERGMRAFIQALEQRLDTRFTHPIAGQQLTLCQCLLEQARQIASRILKEDPGYQGMGFR